MKFLIFFPLGEETNASDQQNEPQLGLKDQQVLDVKSYACLFSKSIETLRVHLAEKGDGAELIWDKVRFENMWQFYITCIFLFLNCNQKLIIFWISFILPEFEDIMLILLECFNF